MRLWDDAKALRRVTLWLYTLVVVSLCVAGFKWLWDSPYFPIKKVHFYGQLHEIDQQKLAEVAQRSINGNFFKADMNRLKQTMAQNAWVETVRVQRLWPDTVNVFVVERQAQAKWDGGGLVDAKGFVFQGKTAKVLPEFGGPKYMMPKLITFQAAITPLLKQQQLQLKQLNISERGAWTMVLNNGVVLKLGRRDLQARVERFLSYWQRDLLPLGGDLEYVDLRYHDGFAIKQHKKPTVLPSNQSPNPTNGQAVLPVADNELNIN